MEYPTIEHKEYGQIQFYTDYFPEFLREQDFAFDYAKRKFSETINTIRALKETNFKMRFRFLTDPIINGVEYEYVEATCQIINGDEGKKHWINIFGKRKVCLSDPKFREKFGQSMSDAARKKLHDQLDEMFLSVTLEKFSDCIRQRVEQYLQNTEEKVNKMRQNIDLVMSEHYFVETHILQIDPRIIHKRHEKVAS